MNREESAVWWKTGAETAILHSNAVLTHGWKKQENKDKEEVLNKRKQRRWLWRSATRGHCWDELECSETGNRGSVGGAMLLPTLVPPWAVTSVWDDNFGRKMAKHGLVSLVGSSGGDWSARGCVEMGSWRCDVVTTCAFPMHSNAVVPPNPVENTRRPVG